MIGFAFLFFVCVGNANAHEKIYAFTMIITGALGVFCYLIAALIDSETYEHLEKLETVSSNSAGDNSGKHVVYVPDYF